MKMYNGEEELTEVERVLLVMIDIDKSSAFELAKGDDILEEYVNEADNVKNTDESLREAYDHEAEMIASAKEDGYEEGIQDGKKETEIEMVKKMIKVGASTEFIKQCSNLTEEEIEELKSK